MQEAEATHGTGLIADPVYHYMVMAVWRTAQGRARSPGVFQYTLEYRPSSQEALWVTIHVTSSAVVYSTGLIRNDLHWFIELRKQLEDWERVARQYIPGVT